MSLTPPPTAGRPVTPNTPAAPVASKDERLRREGRASFLLNRDQKPVKPSGRTAIVPGA